ncbi:MAG: hypothetical protein Q8T09_06995 [Candidatus Melainabacteria bacterium]|nr:hypothetical protein [Candidatus Melainabacteria bacterium]
MKELADLSQYRMKLMLLIRRQEALKLQGDKAKLSELAEIPDDFLLKKWVWTVCLLGGPATFVVLPLLLSVLGIFTPVPIMDFFWFFTKLTMAAVLLLFCLAVYFTLRSNKE